MFTLFEGYWLVMYRSIKIKSLIKFTQDKIKDIRIWYTN